MFIKGRRALSAVLAASVALGAVSLTPATAAPLRGKDQTAVSAATDFSAAKRRPARRGYARNNAAAAAMFLGVIGTIAGIAAQERYERRYRNGYYYGGPYRAYGGDPRCPYGGVYSHAPPYGWGCY